MSNYDQEDISITWFKLIFLAMCVILHYQHQANEKKWSDDVGQSLIRLGKTTSNKNNIIKGQRQTWPLSPNKQKEKRGNRYE